MAGWRHVRSAKGQCPVGRQPRSGLTCEPGQWPPELAICRIGFHSSLACHPVVVPRWPALRTRAYGHEQQRRLYITGVPTYVILTTGDGTGLTLAGSGIAVRILTKFAQS